MVRAQLFTALGKLVAFKDRDLMGKLFIDRFEAVDLLAHRVDLGQQLQRLFDQVFDTSVANLAT